MEVFIFVFVGWIFSVCLHEFGHAIVAYKFGDYTVKDKGYLTMNPIHYTHPVISFVLPLLFVALGGLALPGGAVYIEDSLIRGKGRRALVSLAGPAMNLLLAVLLCVPFWIGLVSAETNNLLPTALAMLISLQISAVILNLLPVPSLDGFRALSEWMPQEMREFAWRYANIFMLILFLLFWRSPQVNRLFWGTVFFACDALGINIRLIAAGWEEFYFWEKTE